MSSTGPRSEGGTQEPGRNRRRCAVRRWRRSATPSLRRGIRDARSRSRRRPRMRHDVQRRVVSADGPDLIPSGLRVRVTPPYVRGKTVVSCPSRRTRSGQRGSARKHVERAVIGAKHVAAQNRTSSFLGCGTRMARQPDRTPAYDRGTGAVWIIALPGSVRGWGSKVGGWPAPPGPGGRPSSAP